MLSLFYLIFHIYEEQKTVPVYVTTYVATGDSPTGKQHCTASYFGSVDKAQDWITVKSEKRNFAVSVHLLFAQS